MKTTATNDTTVKAASDCGSETDDGIKVGAETEGLTYENQVLSQNALECIWVYCLKEQKFVYVSPFSIKLVGCTPAEVKEKSFSEILTEESFAQAYATVKLLLASFKASKDIYDIAVDDYRVFRKDGSVIDIEAAVKLIRDRETGTLKIIGVSRDITKRKQLEKQLKQEIESKNEVIERLKASEDALLLITAELNRKNERLHDIAVKDSLTHIFNRYYFDKKIPEEISRCTQDNYPLSLIVFDIDDFKITNDMRGHDAGDCVLVKISALVTTLLRKQDIFARWGGEEFTVLMPKTGLSTAEAIAEKIRGAIGTLSFKEFEWSITASFGVTEFMYGETKESLFKRADHALLQSKSIGKNRVTAVKWSETIPSIQMRLDWKNEWESGSETIDEQHKRLVFLGNEVLGAMLKNKDNESMTCTLNALMDHIETHFKEEVEIITKAGYPQAEEHKAIHNELLERMYLLKREFFADQLKVGAFFSFLFDEVLVGHLLTEDIKFFPYTRGENIASDTGDI